MAIMYGVATVDEEGNETDDFQKVTTLRRTARKADVTWGTGDNASKVYITVLDEKVELKDPKFYDEMGKEVASATSESEYAYVVGNIGIVGREIVISAGKFPGTYYVTGDTYARSETTGKDEAFQFIIPKAKMLSEVTLTMEAEGDPATFNMSMKVLRPANGQMMKLVKYDVAAG